MGTNDLDDDAFMDQFLQELSDAPDDEFPEWADAEDLGRLHLQSFASELAGGLELHQSRGFLRLTGDGVRGHSLNLDDAGIVLSNFQRLVTSAGASHEGVKYSRGPISQEIIQRTQLALTSSPGRGSVVLEFQPVADESRERYPNGEIPLVGENAPLVEASVDIAFSVLSTAADLDKQLDSVDELFGDLGVRVASAALALAETAASARLDLNLSWQRPGIGRRKVEVSAAQCATFSAVLKGHGLDSDVDTLTGSLRTISDRKKIDLEIDDPENEGQRIIVPIAKGDVDLTPFHLGQLVDISVESRLSIKPGGAERRTYTALFIAPHNHPD
ncbi:hypothetical protein JWS13_38980 [Rhodococcus pseudokoreensis]|uniref:Uncharacterized protein n=1 Tax=Rhodococcus pseudokoreensis TaxID=2811421 RepID=A0A974WAI1_9NOCA|nr:hypothetical protein [Rhodococcus pseudokoreensis]QSE94163.1 hypothetical protein JWS13_38980 [Rhodococcus pseudokoreensis]